MGSHFRQGSSDGQSRADTARRAHTCKGEAITPGHSLQSMFDGAAGRTPPVLNHSVAQPDRCGQTGVPGSGGVWCTPGRALAAPWLEVRRGAAPPAGVRS